MPNKPSRSLTFHTVQSLLPGGLNFSNRMMRPRRASFNILRLDATLASPFPSLVVVATASGAHGVASQRAYIRYGNYGTA